MGKEQVSITVLDQEYKIKCDSSEIDLLKKSASFLDDKMKEIKNDAAAITKDKVAVMAALNVVSLYLNQESTLKEYDSISSEIEKLQNYINSVDNVE
ncbi:MAG: cell division protein ZapA [Pelagibacterales bacterium]|nr:cell division protein ZapA [Pelagibacterales bacterium]|tara:strand:+ start:930 stop:1220 length:291 start_codon:yes stop_codon:yes gene_type:complete